MLIDKRKKELDDLLRRVAQELDVPPSKYEDAREHYDAVGNWLGEKDSPLADYEPIIYPQGSFALGTAIRPIGDDDYDVDAVCLLQLNTSQVTQKQLKDLVGKRLKDPKSRYRTMLDPASGGRRCWTIKYSDESHFHLDVLPALPDSTEWLLHLGVNEEFAKHAIRISDTRTAEYGTGWPAPSRLSVDPTRSNPRGYVGWFKERMRVRLEEQRRMLALSKDGEVEEIEDYEIRTPLQMLIQLLKRHRDEQYNDDEDKPISVIITTLAATAYNNEASIFDAMTNVVPKMRSLIMKRGDVWWVENPVNPLENFADKWQETPRKKRIFFDWLDAVKRDHQRLLTDQGFEKRGEYLAESYGGRYVNSALDGTGISTKAVVATAPTILVPKKTQAAEKHQYQKVNASSPSKPWGIVV